MAGLQFWGGKQIWVTFEWVQRGFLSEEGKGRWTKNVDGQKTEKAWEPTLESGVRNLEAESIKSRAESMGGCVKLKTTCVRKVLLYEKGAGCKVCSQQSRSRQSVWRERGSMVCRTQDLNCLTRIARQQHRRILGICIVDHYSDYFWPQMWFITERQGVREQIWSGYRLHLIIYVDHLSVLVIIIYHHVSCIYCKEKGKLVHIL